MMVCPWCMSPYITAETSCPALVLLGTGMLEIGVKGPETETYDWLLGPLRALHYLRKRSCVVMKTDDLKNVQ